MFCSKCGTDLPDDSRFCRKCGATISASVSTGGGAAAAVAPALAPVMAPGSRKSRVPILLAILLVLVLAVWRLAGTDGIRTVVSTAVPLPTTLKDDAESVRAHSWQAIPLNLPYSGTVTVSISVVRGNPVDVFLTAPDQLQAMNDGRWADVKVYPEFSATKTRTYKREQRLNQGPYYLVMRDTSLGILSSAASDVSVNAQLNP